MGFRVQGLEFRDAGMTLVEGGGKGSMSFGACEVRWWRWLFGNKIPISLRVEGFGQNLPLVPNDELRSPHASLAVLVKALREVLEKARVRVYNNVCTMYNRICAIHGA